MPTPPFLPTTILVGRAGRDGSNVLPTDAAVSQAMKTPGSQTAAELAKLAKLDSPAFAGVPTVNGVPLTNVEGFPDLWSNGDFAAGTTGYTNITGDRSIQTVTDGPAGTTTDVLRITTSSTYARKVITGLIAGAYAGRTMRMRFDGRALVNGPATTAAARFIIKNDDTGTTILDTTITGFTTTSWVKGAHVDIAVPADCNALRIDIGTTSAGSARMEFDNFGFKIAGSTPAEAATIAVASAVAAGQALSPDAAKASFAPQARDAYNRLANGGAITTPVPLDDTTTKVNWRNINDVDRKVVQVTDGPFGETMNVLETRNNPTLASHMATGLIAAGIAGKTGRFRVYARALVNGAVKNADGRVIVGSYPAVQLPSFSADHEPVVPGGGLGWELREVDFGDATTPFPNVDEALVSVSYGAGPGSTRIQWAYPSFGPPVDSVPQARDRATATAKKAADQLYARTLERVDTISSQFLSFSKGGVVGTFGRAPVSLRFDDWWDDIIALGLMDELRNRGLFGSLVWISRLGSKTWNDEVTYPILRNWVHYGGNETWCHGIDHNSPWANSNPLTYNTNLVEQIVTSKAEIEAQGLRVFGWAQPGVSPPGYGYDPTTQGVNLFRDSIAGRLIAANYPLSETDVTGVYRQLPSTLHHGLGHTTISDGMSKAEAKNYIDGAIATRRGLQLMTHAGNLVHAGNPGGSGMTVTDWLEVMDYLVAKRDAGLVEIVQSSSLPFADPWSQIRRDLVGNATFDAAISAGATTLIGNWRGYDGTNVVRAQVTDGPQGGTVWVLRATGANVVNQKHIQCLGQGIAGLPFEIRATARRVGAGVPRIRVYDADNPTNFDLDYQPTLATTWNALPLRRAFTVPTNVATLGIEVGSVSGTVEFDECHVLVA